MVKAKNKRGEKFLQKNQKNWILSMTKVFVFVMMVALLGDGVWVRASEKKDKAESFRYHQGESTECFGSLSSGTAWNRENNVYYSSDGSVINGAFAKGIDVSHNNGVVNWQAVKADGIDFAILRCGYGMDLPDQDDAQWAANVSGCEAVGMPYGVYLYSYANSVAKAVSEADHVLRLIQGKHLQYPVYFDMEEKQMFATTTAQQRAQIAKAFCDRIQAAGYQAAIYSDAYSFTNYLTEPAFDQWGKWIASYNTYCNYGGRYEMWQATNMGQVAGISGNVDISFQISDEIFVKPVIKKLATAGKKKIQVVWNPKQGGAVCQISYSTKKNTGYKVLTRNAKSGKAVIKGLKSGKKYYIRVRLGKTTNGATIFSKYSLLRTIKVK